MDVIAAVPVHMFALISLEPCVPYVSDTASIDNDLELLEA